MVNRFRKTLIHGYHFVFELVYFSFQASELIQIFRQNTKLHHWLVTVIITGRKNLKKLKVAELNNYIFSHNLSRRKMFKSEKLNLLSPHNSKCLCERILTLSAAETAATKDSDTQSEDNVSHG